MATPPQKTTVLRSPDLNCPSCVAKIERSLERVNGVERASVHFTTGRIEVVHDPDVAPTEALVRAVANAGYTARPSAF